VQLAREADGEVAHPQHGAPAGVPRRVVPCGDPQLHPGGLADDPRGLHGVGPARLSPAPPPTPGFPVTGQHHADVHGLGGQRGEDLRHLGVRGALVDAGLGQRELLAVRQHDLPHRVEREVHGAARPVAHERVEQPRQQCGGELRAVGVERVADVHGVAAGVVGGQPERVPRGRSDERERQHLDVARLGQRHRHGAATPLGRGEPASGGRGGQLGRDRLVALQPQHLFDEVGGLGQVRTPRRRGRDDLPAPVAARDQLDGAPHLAEPPRRGPGRVRHARHPVGQVERHLHGGGLGDGADVGAPGRDRAAAVLDEQRRDPLGRDRRQLRVDRALEPAGRLAGQLVPRGAAAIVAGSKCAASITTSIGSVPGRISVDAPPITPARPIGPESSVMSRSSASRRRCTSSRVVSVSPGCARRTTMGPDRRAAS
jgi:hypothetical protein